MLITSNQAALILRMSPQNVVRLADNGKLRIAARVGLQGDRLFEEADVLALKAERDARQGAAVAAASEGTR